MPLECEGTALQNQLELFEARQQSLLQSTQHNGVSAARHCAGRCAGLLL